jgi:hypothetical protein
LPKAHLGHKIERHPTQDLHILISAQNNETPEAPASRGQHQEIKPALIMDYKKNNIGNKSGKMFAFYSFLRKSITEESFLPSLQSVSGKCPHTVQ